MLKLCGTSGALLACATLALGCSGPGALGGEAEDPGTAEQVRLEQELREMTRRATLLEEERRQLLAELEKRAGKPPEACLESAVAAGQVAAAGETPGEVLPAGQAEEARVGERPAAPDGASDERGTEGDAGQETAAAAAPAAPRLSEAPLLLAGGADAQLFDDGAASLDRGDYFQADALLSRFLRDNPRHPFVDDALVLRGEARRLSRRHALAKVDFLTVVERYPDEMRTPDAWLGLGRAQLALGDSGEAGQTFATLCKKFPDSAAALEVPSEYRP